MKATVYVEKSFDDDIGEYSKEYEDGDFKEFFASEGDYLDRLCEILKHGEAGEGFTVNFAVTVKL